jgi:hypothetical protein
MSGHTKGPWRVSKKPDIYFIHGAGCLFIADLVNNNSPEQEANANLVAAAPDLLEALKAIYQDAIARSTEVPSPIVEAVCAAIAKAEGK